MKTAEEKRASQRIRYERFVERNRDRIREKQRAKDRQITPGGVSGRTLRARADRAKRPEFILLRSTRYRARNLGLPFNLTAEDVVVPDVCPVLGIPLRFRVGGTKTGPTANSPSIDRIIPKLGYVKGNVRIISVRANKIKGDATPDELRQVYEYSARSTATVKWRLVA